MHRGDYDHSVINFLSEHPGGKKAILLFAGKVVMKAPGKVRPFVDTPFPFMDLNDPFMDLKVKSKQ